MHKLIRADMLRMQRRWSKLILLANLPSAAVAAAVLIINLIVLPNAPASVCIIYETVFKALYIACAYSFTVTLILSAAETVSLGGHERSTYIELFESQLIVSRHVCTRIEKGRAVYYKQLWIVNLDDVEEVVCTGSSITIKARARYFNQRSDWLECECGPDGRLHFDRWWYDNNGGKAVTTVSFRDDYTYSDNIARRIILRSRKYKAKQQRRSEFRQRMLEIAARNKQTGKELDVRYKRSTRVFR